MDSLPPADGIGSSVFPEVLTNLRHYAPMPEEDRRDDRDDEIED
jgi:hypothetical protein